MDRKAYLSINEVMEHFGVSRSTVNNWISRGLKKTKIGYMVRIKKTDIEKFIGGE